MYFNANRILTVGLLMIAFAIAGIEWIERDEKTTLTSAAGANSQDGIDQVDIEFGRRMIILNVYLSKPITCEQVISSLGIESLPVGERVFVPTCKVINQSLIKITYFESITV